MERAPGRQQSERDSLQRLVSSREKSLMIYKGDEHDWIRKGTTFCWALNVLCVPSVALLIG